MFPLDIHCFKTSLCYAKMKFAIQQKDVAVAFGTFLTIFPRSFSISYSITRHVSSALFKGRINTHSSLFRLMMARTLMSFITR